MLARVRKAITAGILAGISAAAGSIAVGGALTQAEISKAIGIGIGALVVTGWATYRVPNAPMPPTPPYAR